MKYYTIEIFLKFADFQVEVQKTLEMTDAHGNKLLKMNITYNVPKNGIRLINFSNFFELFKFQFENRLN